MIAVWESQLSERQFFPKAQYEHVGRVINGRQTARDQPGQRKRARDRSEVVADSTEDECASSDAGSDYNVGSW